MKPRDPQEMEALGPAEDDWQQQLQEDDAYQRWLDETESQLERKQA